MEVRKLITGNRRGQLCMFLSALSLKEWSLFRTAIIIKKDRLYIGFRRIEDHLESKVTTRFRDGHRQYSSRDNNIFTIVIIAR